MLAAIGISPNGQSFAAAYASQLQIWNVQTGEIQASIQGHFDAWTRFEFSHDGKMLVGYEWGIGSKRDDAVQLWDAASGKPIPGFSIISQSMTSAAFSDDDTRLVINADNGYLWNLRDGNAHLLEQFSNFAVLSPDKQEVVYADEKNFVLHDLSDGSDKVLAPIVPRFHVFDYGIVTAFNPDSSSIAIGERYYDGHCSGFYDNRYLLNLTPLRTKYPWGEGIHNLTFSSDGDVLTSTGEDNSVSRTGSSVINLWDTRTGGNSMTLTNHTGQVIHLTFSKDGRTLVSQSADGTIRSWQVN
jgi:WD40 repeat protein